MLEAFQSLEAWLYPIVCNINVTLSSYILVFLLIGVGLWYSGGCLEICLCGADGRSGV